MGEKIEKLDDLSSLHDFMLFIQTSSSFAEPFVHLVVVSLTSRFECKQRNANA